MLNNYNLFNNRKVDDLTSNFLEMRCYSSDIMEKYIIELLNYYKLEDFCIDISFASDDSYYLGMYSNYQKKLFINYKKIIESFKKISDNDYFIMSNAYRIILHEIKHILQYKMVQKQDNQLFRIFQTEFYNGCKNLIAPSEVNADIESALVIINNFNKNHFLYEKQLIFSINLINSFYDPKCIVGDFCLDNKIKLSDISLLDRFIYGLDNELINCNKILTKKQ